MKYQEKSHFQRICILAGIALLAAACATLIFWQWSIHASQKLSQDCVHTLRTIIPEPQSTVAEERKDNSMPVLSLDGTDFIGILEFPRYGSVLPVCADWKDPVRYPHRLGGSIYNGSIQIGGTSQAGQYDFFREISVGDQLFFTDVEGNRYSFTVSDLRYEKSVDQSALQRRDASLTLFIRNVFSFEYLIVFCDVPQA